MKPPVMAGVIERRLLVNYRVDPEVAAALLPSRLRPQLVEGAAVAGICLIRLGGLRPSKLPPWIGLRSENAAHRIAVEWDTATGVESGVYIPRRDTASLASAVVGGRLFPGEHHLARFHVDERDNRVDVLFASRDGEVRVDVRAELAESLEGSKLFGNLEAASQFFRTGSVGFSPRKSSLHLDGLELETPAWRIEPVHLLEVRSSFFQDPTHFPPGSATLDCALVMRDVIARWIPRGSEPGPVSQPSALAGDNS
jgi:hypothetical protein